MDDFSKSLGPNMVVNAFHNIAYFELLFFVEMRFVYLSAAIFTRDERDFWAALSAARVNLFVSTWFSSE